MPLFEIALDLSARRSYEKIATPVERYRIEDILQSLVKDPYVDDETKFTFTFPPANAVLYSGDEFWVLYEITGQGSILILNIGFEEEIPTPRRDDPPL